jgi:hypothetical protein
MAAGVLNFSQYLGGPDNIQCEQTFPSTQQTLQYNFGVSINGWTFNIEAQTVVVDTVTFDRNSGQPNFASSKVIGFFPTETIDPYIYANYINVTAGLVNITIPANLYTGPILPDARVNVPITIIKVQWTDAGSPAQINSHRWAFIQCYEPGVTPGDPTLVDTIATGYTVIV